MNWEDAKYFLAVARAGKINRAADALGISPITLSRRMAHLQDQMQTTLLTRHNQGVDLTQEGQRFLEYLERAEAEFEAAGERFGAGERSVEGNVRIAAPEGFALKLLAPAMGVWLDAHPRLSIEIVPLPRGLSLSKREADIAIMVDRPDEPKLIWEKLSDYHLGLYAAQSYLERFGAPKDLQALGSHRLIGYVDDLLPSERINTPRAAWSGWQSQIAIYSPIGQLEAVRASAGIGVLHQFLFEPNEELQRVLPEIELTRSFYMVTHQNIIKLPRIAVVMKYLRNLKIGNP